ncbi:DUF6573 family protein [Sorangium sp. So ce321]|uniref:DUF6573 family protein n=1 Tax=Sorangium sp. So ce321 TaxID=3133300 RepID=UPI003F5ED595
MPDNDEIEFEVIEAYTRAQAIADGTLVDVTSTAREMGIKLPVAVTHSVWNRYVVLTPAALRARNDERGRLWDVLWMFRAAALRAPEANETIFSLYVVTDSAKPSLMELKAVCGPGDHAEPVITIMLPEED